MMTVLCWARPVLPAMHSRFGDEHSKLVLGQNGSAYGVFLTNRRPLISYFPSSTIPIASG
jgi:hypothetical protein